MQLNQFCYSFHLPSYILLLGPVNVLYNALEKVWEDSERWLASCYVKRSEYHGGCFEGNDCRKLLKNVHNLRMLSPDTCEVFVSAFGAFNDVVAACYSKDLCPDYKNKIEIFKESYLKLNIPVTPRVHAVYFHVPEFCGLMGMGLAPLERTDH